MHVQPRLFSILVISGVLSVPCLNAQDNPMNDPDLQQLLKQAQQMQKNAKELQKNSGPRDPRKNLADLDAMAKQQAAQQEQDEKRENKNCRLRSRNSWTHKVLSRSPTGYLLHPSSNPQANR